MPTKAKTPAEKRRDHQQQIDTLDLASVQALLAIYERPEIQQAIEDLRALGDEADTGAVHRSPGADVNALVANAMLAFANPPAVALRMQAMLEQRLGLEVTPDPAALAPLPPSE